MKTIARHDEWLMAQLADAEFAAEYLNAASEDDDPKTYLTAMRKVEEARGDGETLYRTLSARGHPTMKTLTAVFEDHRAKVRNFRTLSAC